MSAPKDLAKFLGLLAPQMDNHLLLPIVDFYASRGVDVSAAKQTIVGRTKRFDLTEGSDAAMQELQTTFTKLKNGALPLIRKYFEDKDEGLVLKITESEVLDLKAKEKLSIRARKTTPETVEFTRDPAMNAKQFKQHLEEQFVDPKNPNKIVEVTCETELRTVAGSKKTTPVEIWKVSTTEVSGEILESNFNALLDMAQVLFESGSYKDAYEVLNFCRYVIDSSHPRYLATLWGLFASCILVPVWGAAEAALELIRIHATRDVAVDDDFKVGTEHPTITTRNWMLHWSLFVFFKGGESLSGKFLDILFDTAARYASRTFNSLHTVETVAPHLLRYAVAACLLNRNKRSALFGTLKVVRLCYEHSDALTKFLEMLVGSTNFDEAFKLLPEVSQLVENDYFLSGLKHQIMDGAMKLAYEYFIRTHKTVSIESVAKRLYPASFGGDAATAQEAKSKTELWMANLIRDAKVIAKIDSVGGKIDVHSSAVSIHQKIGEKMSQTPRPQLH